jgi:hypothetical protein
LLVRRIGAAHGLPKRRRSEVVEPAHGVTLGARREVRVSHRLVDSGMAKELLDGLERHPAHHES